ncbi:MAG: acyl-CoA dehydrogenase family protein [Pseudomonadales bacterium]|nr:acyl-CoA dehydrogenase family protein [Pseudomonadales bacterium]
MPESLTESEAALARRARAFAVDVLLPAADLEPGKARALIIDAARKAGFYAMTQPAAFGGTEAGALALTIVRDELAATNAPFTGLVFGPGPGVLGGASGPLRDSHLQPLLEGRLRGAFGFTEPDDAPQPTTAVRDGDFWVVNGQKSYVTGGSDADFINTLVQIPDGGPGMLVIDTGTPGVELTQRFESLDGSHHAAFRFHNARVPANHLIGTPGEGLPRAMRQIGDTRLAFAATCAGQLRWVDEYLTGHLKSPDRTGKPRGDKEGVRLRYAEARIHSFAARSMVYRTARLADRGANIVNEAIACKVFATEAIGDAVDNAIQLVGGNALIQGHPLERLYRQVRALRLAEGGNDVLRLNLARGRLDLGKGVI